MARFVLLYCHTLGLGGTDTLLVRLANTAARNGLESYINSNAGPLSKVLDEKVHDTKTTNFYDFFKEIRGTHNEEIYILVFDPHLMLRFLPYFTTVLGSRRIKILYGIFHPREMFPDNQSHRMHRLMHCIFKHTHCSAWLFMNEVGKQSHSDRFGMDLTDYPTCPILVDHPETVLWSSRTELSPLRIVSVGRIVPFKAYNWGALDIIAQLRSANIDATWTIFGDGAAMESLQQEVKNRGLGDAVLFKGPLPYVNLAEELIQYDVFIGMGTALLEAAGLGMPSLIAVDLSPNTTYGFLDEGPNDSIGEIVEGASEQRMGDALIAYTQMNPTLRAAKGQACRERAIAMSGSLNALVQQFENTPRWRAKDNIVPLLAALLFMSLTNLRRIVRRVLRKPPLPPFN